MPCSACGTTERMVSRSCWSVDLFGSSRSAKYLSISALDTALILDVLDPGVKQPWGHYSMAGDMIRAFVGPQHQRAAEEFLWPMSIAWHATSDAQNRNGSYARALEEMEWTKTSHWMWYVFPQIAGLASSVTSQRFAISSLVEAKHYLKHAILGLRLLEITAATNTHGEENASDIFGFDDVKFRSSMTLFMRADPHNTLFYDALLLFFDGQPDPRTDMHLRVR